MAFKSGKLYIDSAGITLLDSAEGVDYDITTTPSSTISIQYDSDYGLMGGRTGLYTYLNNPSNTGARNTSTGDKTASTN